MQNNDKIQNFFSQQLKEIKEYHNKVWGKVYTEKTREGAIERCLELADFDVCFFINSNSLNFKKPKACLRFSQ